MRKSLIIFAMAALVLCAASCKKNNTNTKKIESVGYSENGTVKKLLTFHWSEDQLDSLGVCYLGDSNGYPFEYFTYQNGRVASSTFGDHDSDYYTTEYTYDGDKIVKISSRINFEWLDYFNITYAFEYQGDHISRILYTQESARNGMDTTGFTYYSLCTWEGDNLVKEESGSMVDGVAGPVTEIQSYTYDNNINPYYKEGFMDFVTMFNPKPVLEKAFLCPHNILSTTVFKADRTGAVADTVSASTFSYTYDEDGYPTAGQYIRRDIESNETVSYSLAFEYVK